MRVSVIIPTFNAANTICDVVNSILEQSIPPFEIIVVDDCSTDDTVKLLKRYKGIKIHTLDTNFGGPARPRNVGIALASGDMLAFCDADDVWHKEKLRIQLEVLNSTDYKLACTEREIVTNLDHYQRTSNSPVLKYKVLTRRSVKFINPIVNSSVLISRQLVGNAQFSEDINLIAVEDYEFYRRILKNYDMIKISSALVGYLSTGEGISSNKLKMIVKIYYLNRLEHGLLKSLIFTIISFVVRVSGRRA